jgi:hypothetical protein
MVSKSGRPEELFIALKSHINIIYPEDIDNMFLRKRCFLATRILMP